MNMKCFELYDHNSSIGMNWHPETVLIIYIGIKLRWTWTLKSDYYDLSWLATDYIDLDRLTWLHFAMINSLRSSLFRFLSRGEINNQGDVSQR